jgi:hypothetical protein
MSYSLSQLGEVQAFWVMGNPPLTPPWGEGGRALPITNYQLPITYYQLPITNYQLPITYDMMQSLSPCS